MSEWDYTNERVLFWMDLNGDFKWVCSTITSQNIYGRDPTIILLTMRPSRLFVKIRCHAVPRKRSAVRNRLGGLEVACPPRKPKMTDSIPAGVIRFSACENRWHACPMIIGHAKDSSSINLAWIGKIKS
ncbi:core histone macro-H2A.1 [Trichonephila clavipes]|uniref:Core histone macro-H2A.1 n=1 Tax=Trichonephila clavipes TaxID=2585209 RepID=A0A8X6W6W0_TRICX|nr:core histone macro-H2A.1 [Trichonephila clavipes]